MLQIFKKELGESLYTQSQRCAESMYKRNQFQERGESVEADLHDDDVKIHEEGINKIKGRNKLKYSIWKTALTYRLIQLQDLVKGMKRSTESFWRKELRKKRKLYD